MLAVGVAYGVVHRHAQRRASWGRDDAADAGARVSAAVDQSSCPRHRREAATTFAAAPHPPPSTSEVARDAYRCAVAGDTGTDATSSTLGNHRRRPRCVMDSASHQKPHGRRGAAAPHGRTLASLTLSDSVAAQLPPPSATLASLLGSRAAAALRVATNHTWGAAASVARFAAAPPQPRPELCCMNSPLFASRTSQRTPRLKSSHKQLPRPGPKPSRILNKTSHTEQMKGSPPSSEASNRYWHFSVGGPHA